MSLIPSNDVIQLTLSPKITTEQVVETSVTFNNSPIHARTTFARDDHAQPTYEMTSAFKPFTKAVLLPF